MQQTNWGLYYRFLTFARSRASYSQTYSDTKRCGTLAHRNRNAQYSSPEIEEKSTGIRHCLAYEYKVSDITMNNIGTATLRHPQLFYASSVIFQRLLLDLWAGIGGVTVSLSQGATTLGIRAGLAVGCPSQVAFGYCICLLHRMHMALLFLY